jgi:hypothetical protein
VVIARIEGDKIWIDVQLKELPRISGWESRVSPLLPSRILRIAQPQECLQVTQSLLDGISAS